MVGHPVLGEIVRTDPLAPVSRADHSFSGFGHFGGGAKGGSEMTFSDPFLSFFAPPISEMAIESFFTAIYLFK